MKNYLGSRNSKNIKSQIAILITFVIAVIILMVIVFINISKVSEVKVATAKAVDTSALAIASSIGSMSHYLKENVLEGEEKICEWTFWVSLAKLIPSLVLATRSLPFELGQLVGESLFKKPSLSIQKAIRETFSEDMNVYNSVRENALYSAVASLQADDVRVVPVGGGIFCEDIDGDGSCDAGGRSFDLSGIDGIGNESSVDRFSAWYHAKRLPLMSEEGLRGKLDDFLSELEEYIKLSEWDDNKWIFNAASFTVKQIASGYGDIDVTCSSGSCPSWVFDAKDDRISISSIKESAKDGDGDYDPFGFLEEKFQSLSKRLKASYPEDISFCPDKPPWWCLWCTSDCAEVEAAVKHLTEFVAKIKEVLELPTSIREQTMNVWFAPFYDVDYTHSLEGGDHDIYDQLTLVSKHIFDWHTELSALNSEIISDIEKKRGECTWGRGSSVERYCYRDFPCANNKDKCGCHYCEGSSGGCGLHSCASFCCWCETSIICAWEGTYYTCCKKPPVCSSGDLYKHIPDWCNSHGAHDNCHHNCSKCSNDFSNGCEGDADNFQGELAHDNTSGPTEVGQAMEILEALWTAIDEIKREIKKFSDEMEAVLAGDDPLRNEIVYAWKGKDERQHLVRAAIENYPEKFPSIAERKNYWGLIKCFALENARNTAATDNPFHFTTARYDEDITVATWDMRYRKKLGEGEEFSKSSLGAIITDVFDDAKISVSNQLLVADLVGNYAIFSEVKGYYGPEKEDIRIERVQ